MVSLPKSYLPSEKPLSYEICIQAQKGERTYPSNIRQRKERADKWDLSKEGDNDGEEVAIAQSFSSTFNLISKRKEREDAPKEIQEPKSLNTHPHKRPFKKDE